ncbi:MAG: hypothetical protein ACRCUF_20485 [Aeromonas sobria]
MTLKDISTVITTLALTLGLVTFAQWNADQSVKAREAQLEQAAQKGKRWMADTTARLDTIQAGIEAITGETNALARQVEDLADRMDRAEL